MNYRLAQLSDISKIVKLHRRVFGSIGAHFLPRLGEDCLIEMYSYLLHIEPEGFIVVQNNDIIGFAIGVSDIKKIDGVLPKLLLKIIMGRYDLELTPIELVSQGSRWIKYLLITKRYARAELLDIVIDESFRGRGIGTMLASMFFEFLKRKGASMTQVLVEERWIEAQRFYRELGFKYATSLNTPNGRMFIMVKYLSSKVT